MSELSESERMELAAIRGHEEAKTRLLRIRSHNIVKKLEEECTELEFAKIVTDDIKKNRKLKRMEVENQSEL